MRNNQPITQRERTFPAQQRLISTTNAKGVITYCNDAFVEISGFTREELTGAPHNLVRHPDVPPAVFAHMWQTLKQGQPWMGIVKNRCKSGDHYWVNAYVTPIFDNNQVVGFESVRVKWFNRLRGFGFLTRGEGTPDIFVHMETLRRYGLAELRPGQTVLVRFGPGPKGMMAAEVRPDGGSLGPASH